MGIFKIIRIFNKKGLSIDIGIKILQINYNKCSNFTNILCGKHSTRATQNRMYDYYMCDTCCWYENT